MTNFDQYLQTQLEDPEFRAHYSLAREKARLEMLVETLKQHVEEEKSRSTILRDVKRIEQHLSRISLV